jgi:Peptidase family M48
MPVREEPHRFFGCVIVWLVLLPLWSVVAYPQETSPAEVPKQFILDMQTAARLRPQLLAQSAAPVGRYATGRQVFTSLVAQLRTSGNTKFAWELRLVNDGQLNAYSSPDGTVYVESGLAQLAGASTGLWAAILSHEIAHVIRRDWARRYLYQKYLENGGGAAIVLGDPSLPSASWSDSEKASEDFGRFCRHMELDADREGLMLMARAGYHPDFVPALHHLLHAQSSHGTTTSLYAMHPCWEERDRELSRAYEEASSEFARLWTEWYESPGGNPPVVVFAEEPKVKKTASREWEIQIPMHCQNLAGAVEVVLHSGSPTGIGTHREVATDPVLSHDEVRQLTGCTSPRTTVTFTLTDTLNRINPTQHWTDVYVLDSWGTILARADLPGLRH